MASKRRGRWKKSNIDKALEVAGACLAVKRRTGWNIEIVDATANKMLFQVKSFEGEAGCER